MLLAADTGLDDFVQQGKSSAEASTTGSGVLLGAAGPSKHDFYLDKTVVGFPLLPA